MANGQMGRDLECAIIKATTALTTVTCIREMHNVSTGIANVANSIIRANYKGTKHKHLKDNSS